jgi:hypothetical protein
LAISHYGDSLPLALVQKFVELYPENAKEQLTNSEYDGCNDEGQLLLEQLFGSCCSQQVLDYVVSILPKTVNTFCVLSSKRRQHSMGIIKVDILSNRIIPQLQELTVGPGVYYCSLIGFAFFL